MKIQKTDFNRTLDDFLGDSDFELASFVDGEDTYIIRMQREWGIMDNFIDCYPTLNDKNATHVRRSQPLSTTVGELLLMIASAPPGMPAWKFFR